MTAFIGLSAYAGSGKDEVAAFLVREHGVVRFAFADALKDVAMAVNPVIGTGAPEGSFHHRAEMVNEYGWDTAKQVPEVRRLAARRVRLPAALRGPRHPDAG